MTMTVDITGCHKLLEQLYHDTINQNTNLMEIFSIVKSSTTITTTTKSSSLPTIARGLQTKHSKLLLLINQSLKIYKVILLMKKIFSKVLLMNLLFGLMVIIL